MSDLRKQVYLTFDIDWARDEVIGNALDIVEKADVSATVFVTHDTPLLARMRENPKIELGVHPNFVPLEKVHFDVTDFISWARYRLEGYKKLVPEATSIRSHGLTQNSKLLDLMKDMGYLRESNLLITLSSGLTLTPFYHWNGLLRVPYFWEDDIHCVEMARGTYKNWRIEPFVYSNSIKIFDFHPIHLFLNTEKLERYEKARPYFKQGNELHKYINYGEEGDRIFLEQLIAFGKEEKYEFKRIDEIEL